MKLIIVLHLFVITPIAIFAFPTINGLNRFPHICPKHEKKVHKSDIPEKTRTISNSNVIRVSDWQSTPVPTMAEKSIVKPPALLKDHRYVIEMPLIETNDINEDVKLTREQVKTEYELDVITPEAKEEFHNLEKISGKLQNNVDEVEKEADKIQVNENAPKLEINVHSKLVDIVNSTLNVNESLIEDIEDQIYPIDEKEESLKEVPAEKNPKIEVEENAQKVHGKYQKVEAVEESLKTEGEEKNLKVAKEEKSIRTVQPEIPYVELEYNNYHIIPKTKHIGCVCALFSSKCPVESDVPLMSKTYHNVSCHEQVSGEDACMKTCIAFALSYYEMKDDVICSHAKNAAHLAVYLHSKYCQENEKWTFTGLMTPTSVCCIEGAPVDCKKIRQMFL